MPQHATQTFLYSPTSETVATVHVQKKADTEHKKEQVIIGWEGGKEMEGKTFHEKAGWIIAVGVSVITLREDT